MQDAWAAASAYEDFMGRWSRQLAGQFVQWLGIGPGAHWLDVGCGTGALARAIGAQAEPASVTACDPAEPFVEFARHQVNDDRFTFVAAGTGQLPSRPGGYTSIASLLAFNFFPDAEASLQEMQRLLSPGGTVSACVWDYAAGMEFLRHFWDAAIAVDPGARALDEGQRFPICHPDRLRSLFQEADLDGVRIAALDIPTEFDGFDDVWRPFMGGTGPAPSYLASLDPGGRAAVARQLATRLPTAPDGAIRLTARAWAVAGSAK